jgi:hypothetical protein
VCSGCEAFHDEVAVREPAAWAAVVARAAAAIAEGALALVDGPPLDAAPPRGPRRHVLQCATCAQLFILEAGACHVIGDRWRPLHGN